jgi:hypothetical protein
MGKLTLYVGRSVLDWRGLVLARRLRLTELTDSGLEHLILSGQHLGLGLVESALVTVCAEQPVLALRVIW